jgi:hypothetical protein
LLYWSTAPVVVYEKEQLKAFRTQDGTGIAIENGSSSANIALFRDLIHTKISD